MSEGSDLGVRQPGEQGQQGGEEVLIINETVPTGAHQNLSKLTQASFEALQLRTWCAQRVIHRILEEERKQTKCDEISSTMPCTKNLWFALLITSTSAPNLCLSH